MCRLADSLAGQAAKPAAVRFSSIILVILPEKEGVLWQAQGERRWLAGLLGNEKAVAPLLRFLKIIDVGGREGARERELEWERKNEQAGEDLLR